MKSPLVTSHLRGLKPFFFLFVYGLLTASSSLHAQMRRVYTDPVDPQNSVMKLSMYRPDEGYIAFSK